MVVICLNPLSANPTKWSSTLKQFVGNMPMNCLSVFDHFVGLALKGLKELLIQFINFDLFFLTVGMDLMAQVHTEAATRGFL